ncbi:MAG TPA: hypothetical protein DEB30_01435 [Candidatus Peribacter riflensis]|uniref:Uncharacterized protein n=1 Tax=Candidatus Peribacter riflensis TaxID=1735162 RepID=A0A0S1STU9_9BACT|nr:MAG: hypothetical protein PeribacterA2_1090 [Candidatus Peribacter riflensis]OGJ77939.1 MAG: hypothetical protein A2398_01435 [Candidatus Peribacteria bacterium RIFOXYB1_FULL_57_12]ALM11548.1 MAG: hypothetical protein PeribacterB2_1092 [Candidatus Peribacter riflensis]ALM12650.1 MAG: hypothetical protein PeribacterC2_1091 [Candidatus Peribacter riflensis]ALM13751.1 MAG: hypothetical protein PeribacterD1_1090 [Candidatus Peribacter riflensis]
MDIIPLLQALPQAVFTPEFFMVCVLVFFICEALFKIPQLDDLEWGKPVIALVVGALLSVFQVGVSVDALLIGLVAGGVTTLAVSRLDYWFTRKK